MTMSDDVGRHLTSDDDGDTSKDMTFCIQIFNHSQWASKRTLVCGSCVEIPLYSDIREMFRVNEDMLDIDQMHYSTYHFAANRSVNLPETYTGSIIRIYTDDVHTG